MVQVRLSAKLFFTLLYKFASFRFVSFCFFVLFLIILYFPLGWFLFISLATFLRYTRISSNVYIILAHSYTVHALPIEI